MLGFVTRKILDETKIAILKAAKEDLGNFADAHNRLRDEHDALMSKVIALEMQVSALKKQKQPAKPKNPEVKPVATDG